MTEECSSDILSAFDIPGAFESVAELKRGHINDTFVSTWQNNGTKKSYVHQLLNQDVFPQIGNLMSNVERVLKHLHSYQGQLNDLEDARRLTLIRTKSGDSYLKTKNHLAWRTYEYVPNTTSFLVCENDKLAYEAARACGYFQKALCECDVTDFYEVISDFINMPKRYMALKSAVAEDVVDRVAEVAKELEFLEQRSASFSMIVDAWESSSIPVRVAHNDVKYNNVLFDQDSLRAVCVVDLDTCMPGTPLYDFGDLVRSTAATAQEDEDDLEVVGFNLAYFKALAEGFLSVLRDDLEAEELRLMRYMPAFVTTLIGTRFLTDFLHGDIYFKTEYREHNLVRARNQFKVVREIERHQAEIDQVIDAL